MLEVKGKYNSAKIFATIVENEAIQQIYGLLNCEAYKDSKIRFMPDVHAGAGCTIGTTMTIHDRICPNLVGVDIGCGMYVVKLGKIDIDLEKFDKACHEAVKSGMHVWPSGDVKKADKENILKVIDNIKCEKINKNNAVASIGTLGGGNHFIELDKDEEGNSYLVIHCGSRHLGLEVANYYQDKAWASILDDRKEKDAIISKLKKEGREKDIEIALNSYFAKKPKVEKDLAWCEGEDFDNYMNDVHYTQIFADMNRKSIAKRLLSYMGIVDDFESFTTIHNYIDTENMILRKGSVSAKKDEMLLIPMNMRDGSLLCIGKGNEDWNCSAPHGAGRIMSRAKAKKDIAMEDFKKSMNGIYTSCVLPETIDESPMAYKPADVIMDDVKDTVEIVKVIHPYFNFKASE
jgi:RNA-splicing ligase RtcB